PKLTVSISADKSRPKDRCWTAREIAAPHFDRGNRAGHRWYRVHQAHGGTIALPVTRRSQPPGSSATFPAEREQTGRRERRPLLRGKPVSDWHRYSGNAPSDPACARDLARSIRAGSPLANAQNVSA